MSRKQETHKVVDELECKLCCSCKEWKLLSEFWSNKSRWDNLQSMCINCSIEYKQINKNKIKKQRRKEYLRNYDKYVKYREENREKAIEYAREYHKSHKKEMKAYRQKNKKRIAKRYNEYEKERRETDIDFKLRKALRNRIICAVKRDSRSSHTQELLGCSIEEFKNYLEEKFDKNMNWENHGSYWHIDHIRPCASFDLSDKNQQRICFHYTNMQPLEAKENYKKGAFY